MGQQAIKSLPLGEVDENALLEVLKRKSVRRLMSLIMTTLYVGSWIILLVGVGLV